MFDPALTAVVANPVAGAGRASAAWQAARDAFASAGLSPRFLLTSGIGDGQRLAEQAVREGATHVFSLGGDGTHNEVLDGILRARPEAGAVTMGILPCGTGGDFRRLLLHGMLPPADAARALLTAASAPIDVGHVRFRSHSGEDVERHFLNIASTGIAGLVDTYVNASGKRLGGRISFLAATVRALLRYRPARVRVEVDGAIVGEWTVTNVALANGRWFGGGMMVAPNARLADGLLHVVVIEDVPLWRAARTLPRLYDGTHLTDPAVHEFIGATARVTVLDDRVAWMDIDGEAPGVAPCEARLLPGHIRMLGVDPAWIRPA